MMSQLDLDIILDLLHHWVMRTTLAIDDDVLDELKRYSSARRIPLGRAVTHLVKRALQAEQPTKKVNGLLVFDLPPDSPVVTSSHIKNLESELG